MFTADLLHDETAEIARLAEQVTALQTQVDVLAQENATLQEQAAGHAVREQVWDWFRTGGPDDETTREQAAREVCGQFLTLGDVEPGLVTAAAVALVESCPSGLSDAQVVAAAAACRQVVTFAELTQASLTRSWPGGTRPATTPNRPSTSTPTRQDSTLTPTLGPMAGGGSRRG